MPGIRLFIDLDEEFARAMTEDEARDLGLMLRDQARNKLGLDSLAPAGTMAQGRIGAMVTAGEIGRFTDAMRKAKAKPGQVVAVEDVDS